MTLGVPGLRASGAAGAAFDEHGALATERPRPASSAVRSASSFGRSGVLTRTMLTSPSTPLGSTCGLSATLACMAHSCSRCLNESSSSSQLWPIPLAPSPLAPSEPASRCSLDCGALEPSDNSDSWEEPRRRVLRGSLCPYARLAMERQLMARLHASASVNTLLSSNVCAISSPPSRCSLANRPASSASRRPAMRDWKFCARREGSRGRCWTT